MLRTLYPIVALAVALLLAGGVNAQEIIDLAKAQADPDFAIQGEYLGEITQSDGKVEKVAAQVIAQGDGKFKVVGYMGGLPGDGWKRDDDRCFLEGTADSLVSTDDLKLIGKIADGVFTVTNEDGNKKVELKRTERKSPTLGAKPPAGAVVLFDGSNADAFDHGTLTKDKSILSGITTKQEFGSYNLHLEFCLSWMPKARGQGRSNSGVYIYDTYECQVLDSFGLEGRNNECGGFYSIREPDVNMCLPPLTWQTYDMDFTAPKYEDGKKVAKGHIIIKHNGVVIHDVEFPRGTPGRKSEGPGPRALHLQGHGNKVQYRNIWLVPKD